jgi:hypothetical protein
MLRHPSRRLKLRCATWFLALLVLGLVLTPASRAAYDPDRDVYQLPDETGGIETGGDPDGVGLDNSPPEEDPPFAPDPDGTLNPFERNLGDWLEILAAVFRTTI